MLDRLSWWPSKGQNDGRGRDGEPAGILPPFIPHAAIYCSPQDAGQLDAGACTAEISVMDAK